MADSDYGTLSGFRNLLRKQSGADMTFSKDGSGQNTPPAAAMATGMDTVDTQTPSMSTPVSLGESKVSIHSLPTGVKAGDKVTLKVSRIDPESNCAYLTQDTPETGAEDNEGGEKMGKEESTDGAVSPDDQAPEKGIDTDLLTGPLSNLKNYLAQKSVDNQTRTYTK